MEKPIHVSIAVVFLLTLLILPGCGSLDAEASAPAPAYAPSPSPPGGPSDGAMAAPRQPIAQTDQTALMPPMRNYSPPAANVSMYPLSGPQPGGAPPPPSPTLPPATYAAAGGPQYGPAYTPPASGVCWVVPPGQTVMPDPPSVTVSISGAVISSTSAGSLQPPTTPYYGNSPATVPAMERAYDQPNFGTPFPAATPPAAVSVPALPAPYRETAAFAPPAGGFQLVPAPDVPSTRTGDAAPAQWFEIKRPGDGPIRIGRVSASCVCIGVRVPNRYIAQGERALVEARVLSRPPANNLTYVIYVNTIEPEAELLTADVTVRLG